MVVAASTIRPAAASDMPPSTVGFTPMRWIELLGEPGADDDAERHGQEREAGLQRRVAEDLLHVERGEEEHREQPADDEQHHERWPRQRAELKMPEPDRAARPSAAR